MSKNREQNGIDNAPNYIKRYLLRNDIYPLKNPTFRLYYTSHSETSQNLDIFVEDSFRQVVTKNFSFQNFSTNEN